MMMMMFLRENSTVAIRIFSIICFEAVAHGLDDVSNNQLKLRTFRFPFNYDL